MIGVKYMIGVNLLICCRLQYREAVMLPVHDAQLVAICQSLWNRLRYIHRKRRELQTVKFIDK